MEKSKPKRSKDLNLEKDSTIKKLLKEEIIFNIYEACAKDKDKEIKIYLQHINFPVPIKYSDEILGQFKMNNTIKDYSIVQEKTKHSVIFEEPMEPEIDILPLASYEDLESVPKVERILDVSEENYVAIIKCDCNKIITALEEDFKKTKEKKQQISKRREILESFKTEQTLTCEAFSSKEVLEFGVQSGYFIYGKMIGRTEPGTAEYKVLKKLLENLNEKIDTPTLLKIMSKKELSENDLYFGTRGSELKDCIKRIGEKLGMTKGTKVNEDIIEVGDGYRMKGKRRSIN